jgi:hypothetical protein
MRPRIWHTLELAGRVLDHVAMNYFEHYAIIAFVDDVAAVRGEKFAAADP